MNIFLTATTTVLKNTYYQNWGCASFVFAIVAAMAGATIYIHRQNDKDVRRIVLTIKAQISSLFINSILNEARLLISMIDEHLPDSLSQVSATMTSKSKFDVFCDSLKNLNSGSALSEENSERNKYAGIIKTAFSGILIEEANKLIKIIELSPRFDDTLYNSTGFRFGLEGETSSRIDFIARKMMLIEKWQKGYYGLRGITKFALGIGTIIGSFFFIPVFFFEGRIAEIIANIFISGMIIGGLGGIISCVLFLMYESKLKKEQIRCENDPGFSKAFLEWKGKVL